MIRLLSITCLAAMLQVTAAAAAEGDPKRGAEVYRACVACHALEPDLHLSGPSLDGFWGRQAGTAESFGRYSAGLKRSEEHTSELQSLMRISYAVFCLKKKKKEH